MISRFPWFRYGWTKSEQWTTNISKWYFNGSLHSHHNWVYLGGISSIFFDVDATPDAARFKDNPPRGDLTTLGLGVHCPVKHSLRLIDKHRVNRAAGARKELNLIFQSPNFQGWKSGKRYHREQFLLAEKKSRGVVLNPRLSFVGDSFAFYGFLTKNHTFHMRWRNILESRIFLSFPGQSQA